MAVRNAGSQATEQPFSSEGRCSTMVQKVRDVMSASPVTVGGDASIADVARTMRDKNIGDVLVTEGDRLVGLVTDRDLVVRGLANGPEAAKTRVDEVCSADLVTLRPDDDVAEAVRVMRDRAIRRIPVVDKGHAVGMVSIGDLAIERDAKSALADISAAKPNK